MAFLRPGVFFALILTLLSFGVAQQPAENQTIFTISVAAPTKAKDVQVRYFYTGESGSYESSVASPTDDNKIVIKTGVEGKTAKTFKLVAFAPGCQFVTISVDDLSANRQGEFQCTALNTVQFNGRVNDSAMAQKSLRVQILYNCNWCPQFFGMNEGALSPLSLGKADVASDGTFIFDLPNFSADPLWSSLSHSASLTFYALDNESGDLLAALRPQGESFKGGTVPVAPTYPEVQFVKTN